MGNLPDTIYQEWIKETGALKIKADTTAVAVVGELTRALKRVTNKHGGTAYIVNGIRYDMNNKPLSNKKEK